MIRLVIEVLKRSMTGLGIATIITFSFFTIMVIQDIQVPTFIIWKNMLGAIVMGLYFGNASLLFEIEKWSPLKQTVIHFLLSIVVWLPITIWLGWLPFNWLALLIGITGFLLVYILFWFSSFLYFKKLESEMNGSIKRP